MFIITSVHLGTVIKSHGKKYYKEKTKQNGHTKNVQQNKSQHAFVSTAQQAVFSGS